MEVRSGKDEDDEREEGSMLAFRISARNFSQGNLQQGRKWEMNRVKCNRKFISSFHDSSSSLFIFYCSCDDYRIPFHLTKRPSYFARLCHPCNFLTRWRWDTKFIHYFPMRFTSQLHLCKIIFFFKLRAPGVVMRPWFTAVWFSMLMIGTRTYRSIFPEDPPSRKLDQDTDLWDGLSRWRAFSFRFCLEKHHTIRE